jgi:hypothetical protein
MVMPVVDDFTIIVVDEGEAFMVGDLRLPLHMQHNNNRLSLATDAERRDILPPAAPPILAAVLARPVAAVPPDSLGSAHAPLPQLVGTPPLPKQGSLPVLVTLAPAVPTLSGGRRTFLVVPSFFWYISTEEV